MIRGKVRHPRIPGFDYYGYSGELPPGVLFREGKLYDTKTGKELESFSLSELILGLNKEKPVPPSRSSMTSVIDESRFDYVAYDEVSKNQQAAFKAQVIALEKNLSEVLIPGQWKEYAIEKLEEFYMAIGKGIRDRQRAEGRSAALQEQRTNA